MRTSHVAPIAAVILLSLIPAVPASAAPAADTAPPRLHSITFDAPSATVSGVQTRFVGVRVRLTDETGVEPEDYLPSQQLASPYLQLNASPNSIVLLRLSEGTAQDGIWTGSIPVTSAWSGTVTPIRIRAMDATWRNTLNVDPATVVDTPSLQVTSSHRPSIEMTFTPEPLPEGRPVVQKIRIWDTTTGKPWPNLPFKLSYDNGCVEPAGVTQATTGPTGVYQRTLSADVAQWLQCAWVPGANQPGMIHPPTVIASVSRHIRTVRYTVTATPAATSVKAGTNVNVTGQLSPPEPGKVVELQRRYADNSWRTVNTGVVTDSGRYTVVATPPGKATYSYRVHAPGDASAVGGVSKVFTIRGV